MVLVIKVRNDRRDIGRPQVAMHRNCHFSIVIGVARGAVGAPAPPQGGEKI